MWVKTLTSEADRFLQHLFEALSRGNCAVPGTLILMKNNVKTFIYRTLIYDVCLSYYGVTDINQLQTIYQLKYLLDPRYGDMEIDTGDSSILKQIYAVTLPAVKYKLILAYKEIFEEQDLIYRSFIDRSYARYALRFLALTKQIILDVNVLAAFIKSDYFIFEYALDLGLFLRHLWI